MRPRGTGRPQWVQAVAARAGRGVMSEGRAVTARILLVRSHPVVLDGGDCGLQQARSPWLIGFGRGLESLVEGGAADFGGDDGGDVDAAQRGHDAERDDDDRGEGGEAVAEGAGEFLEAESEQAHEGEGAHPEGCHDGGAEEGGARAGGDDDEGVEPAAGEEGCEQADRGGAVEWFEPERAAVGGLGGLLERLGGLDDLADEAEVLGQCTDPSRTISTPAMMALVRTPSLRRAPMSVAAPIAPATRPRAV
jgi:hypothetical protein